MTGVERAERYIKYALRKRSLVPTFVKLAAQRHRDDLKRKDVYFDDKAAEIAIGNIELLVHARGQLQGQNIVLEDWECFAVAMIFGWKWTATNLRRFRYAVILVPRKNGKSLLAISIGLIMLGLDSEPGAEVYFGATSEGHARDLLFNPAKYICEKSPDFVEASGIEINAGSLVIPETFSKLKSVIRKPDDGYSPHCAIVDEYHEHEDDTQYATFDTGQGSRRQPLLLIVSGPIRAYCARSTRI
jgi:phage terminase large subunit-like protein